MTDIKVKIRRLKGNDDIPLPCYMTEQAAGMDVFAALREDAVISPGDWMLVPTGISIALPEGFEAEMRPRSGLALRHGVSLLNSPGTIDSDYRGEIGVILINHGPEPFVVKRGDRIAQMIVRAVSRVIWEENSRLDATIRGSGGFGHTK